LISGLRDIFFDIGPITVTLRFIRASLQLPCPVLNPSVNPWTQRCADFAEVDQEFENTDIDDHKQNRGCNDEDEPK
jgi:hypothetical protein